MRKRIIYLAILSLLSTLSGVAVAQRYVDGGGSCSGNMPCYTTIQAAINASSNGGTVTVYPRTYTENITINKSITLVSTGGRGSTTIVGTQTGSTNGTVEISGSTTGLSIGTAPSNGFTIIGVDLATNVTDVGAVFIYAPGPHTNLSIIGNDIRANGDDGFITQSVTLNGFIFDNNILSGKSFIGTQPNQTCCSTACYFDNTLSNVARPLFYLGSGASNVRFTNNQITGTTGAGSNGNILVHIEATNAVVEQNTFSGTTVSMSASCNRGSLRVRGTGFTIDCNQFNSAGLSGPGAFHIQFDKSNSFTGGSATVNTLAGVAKYNNYDANPVAYFAPLGGFCPDSQRSVFINSAAAAAYRACGGTAQTVNGSCTTALPVELVLFNGRVLDNRGIELNWQTATERNNSHFEVQRSTDAEQFAVIGQVSGSGTTYKSNTYSHTDDQPSAGTNYYRLKQVDFDGTAAYSKTIAITFRGGNFLTVYPNPVTDQVSIQFRETTDIQSIRVYDQSGRMLRQFNPAKTISLGGLSRGIYYLEIMTRDGQTYRKSITKH